MNQRTVVCILALATLAACGNGAVMQSADGRYRVVHQSDARWKGDVARTEMESVLERFPQIDVIYAHNDPMAHGAAQACKQKGRTGVRIIGVDGLAGEGLEYVAQGLLDATFEYPTCGAAAIDLGLLAVSGIDVPKEFELGTRLFTKANLAAGGEVEAAPGDFALAGLRRQHAAILTTEPANDVVFRFGMAQCTDDEPWRVAMRRDLQAAADRYPQVVLDYRAADDDVEKQRGIVRDFIAQGFNCILISPKESLALAAACKEAMAAGIKVIVIDRRLGSDDYTSFVGGSNRRIGEQAGHYIASLLGDDGGTIVELQGLMTSSPGQDRHAGFAEALGLKRP
ncbi:MAG: substrate-binding domain-containing protein [Planctomycetes bacterium]|nr:substrate-binding domain-containing protein [Planctomycetota bacterium]